ncbi:glycosyltransferase family 2 protein [Neobacillus sp. Marseille-QA0830]
MISVVVCTNRENFVPHIIENFQKQKIEEKELLLILNAPIKKIDLSHADMKVFSFPEHVSLGECLNFGIKEAKYNFIAKMDDDDYYGANYLQDAYLGLKQTGADVVGKSTFYIYFQNNHELRLYNPNHEQKWLDSKGLYQSADFMSGATLVFKKEIFQKVKFPDVNRGEDSGFLRLCYKNELKIYSLSKNYYAYVRYGSQHHHSDVKDYVLRKRSRFVANIPAIEGFFG